MPLEASRWVCPLAIGNNIGIKLVATLKFIKTHNPDVCMVNEILVDKPKTLLFYIIGYFPIKPKENIQLWTSCMNC